MASSTSPIFTGNSQFSADFQKVVTRAVSIATLPLTQLQNGLTTLQGKQSAYTTLQSKLANVQSAFQNVATMATTNFSVSSSADTVATVATTSSAQECTFDVDVTTAGAYTVAISADPAASGSPVNAVSDPATANIHAGTSFQLKVGTNAPVTLTLGSSNLISLTTAINNANAGVKATILNLGSSTSPDYRMSLRSTAWDNVAIQLEAGSDELVSVAPGSAGNKAVYTLNGIPSGGIQTSSANVTLSPGITATLTGITGDTTITVGSNRTGVTNAVYTLVSAYNSAMTELNKYHGQNAGILEGDSQIRTIATQLRQVANYGAGSGSMTLASLGVTFDKTGNLQFDASILAKVSDSEIKSFFDTSSTTTGFMATANLLVKGIGDGILTDTQDVLTSAIARQNSQIDATQNRIDLLQNSLNAKMAAADAAISALEQQSSYFTNLFAAMKQNSQNYN